MNKELDDKLCKKYPKIFADRYASMQTTCMCWGFDCNDGWYWLIDNLCNTIQNYIDQNQHLNISQVVATQVKEKFGGLRFYINGGDEHIDGIIWLAESLSYHICEKCGSTKDVSQTEGWVYTECPDCKFKRENYGRRQQYLWWVLISPKSGWFQRRYIFRKICQKLYNIYKPLTTIKTYLTTFKK